MRNGITVDITSRNDLPGNIIIDLYIPAAGRIITEQKRSDDLDDHHHRTDHNDHPPLIHFCDLAQNKRQKFPDLILKEINDSRINTYKQDK